MKLFLNDCAYYAQLPSGHWGGQSEAGWKVSTEAYPAGQRPDRFKYEPARRATAEEKTWLRQEDTRLTGIVTGVVCAEVVHYHSGVDVYATEKVALHEAEWDHYRRRWITYIN